MAGACGKLCLSLQLLLLVVHVSQCLREAGFSCRSEDFCPSICYSLLIDQTFPDLWGKQLTASQILAGKDRQKRVYACLLQ